MPQIHVLDPKTIDLIAAGEVVEKPSSVVKELVENALDAGANAVTVEIRDGGIGMVRVTDNGCGISADQVRSAFLRHATSKIQTAQDLESIRSLGFRGEALSSIAAVSQVELITKTAGSLTGIKLCLEGGVETSFEEIGAPEGTTFIMRNLFFNTPVRKKFLKQTVTETGYVSDLMEHLALSHPDVSFRFIVSNQPRFHTSGNGDLKEVIYRIYGREVANAVIPIQWEEKDLKVEGYLGKPTLVRSVRNFEIYFVNGRFIKSTVFAKALEEGYKEYLMQHKFPLAILHVTMNPEMVDVNVHPTKMDVRFWDNKAFSDFLSEAVRTTLKNHEMIPQDRLEDQKVLEKNAVKEREGFVQKNAPEPFESTRLHQHVLMEQSNYGDFEKSPVWERVREVTRKPEEKAVAQMAVEETGETQETDDFFVVTKESYRGEQDDAVTDVKTSVGNGAENAMSPVAEKTEDSTESGQWREAKQMNLFEDRLLSQNKRDQYKLIGQVFDTYWMFEYDNKLCILDQHAAHEKIKYERFIKRYREKEICSQELMPPIVLTLTGQEESRLKEYWDILESMGFEMEEFGGSEYCLRGVPVDLYGCSEKEMFLELLDELESDVSRRNPRLVEERIATMACKAAVKGNTRLSREEAQRLIDELLTLDNPYNCPHGRPTIITISKTEMEKKFKRIV